VIELVDQLPTTTSGKIRRVKIGERSARSVHAVTRTVA